MIEFQTAPAALPDGQRVYAVGDVHGCLERLVALHEAIAAAIAEELAAEASERMHGGVGALDQRGRRSEGDRSRGKMAGEAGVQFGCARAQ